MAAIAPLEDLKAVERDVEEFKKSYPNASKSLKKLFLNHRPKGYNNICRMIMGEVTPESLKS